MSKAIIGGLAVAASALVACSGSTTSSTGSNTVSGNEGKVGLHLTLADGSTLSSLSWTLLTGTTVDQTGTITLPTGSFTTPYPVNTTEIAPVAPGTGYTIKVTGTATPDGVTCSGLSSAFSVNPQVETNVTVVVTCTSTNETGSIMVNPILQFCPTLETLTPISSTPQFTTTAIGGTVQITAAASGPNQAGVTYTWTDNSPAVGTLGAPTNNAGLSSQVVFTCNTSGSGSVTVATADQASTTLVCSDQSAAGNATCAASTSAVGTACGTGGTCAAVPCPSSMTTSTVSFVCGNPAACTGVGTGVEVTGNSATGTCPQGSINTGTLKDGLGNYCCSNDVTPCNNPLVGSGTPANPPTSQTGTCPGTQQVVGQDQGGLWCCGVFTAKACTTNTTNCVQCTGSNGGLCTPTEAAIVNQDISAGNASLAGGLGPNSCYSCLVLNSCIDDNGGDVNKECEDNTGSAAYTGGTTVAECESVLSCILGSAGNPANPANECANNGVSGCYCGTDPAAACGSGSATSPVTAGVNGACASQIATGLGFPLGDGQDIGKSLTVKTLAAGRAASIFACATSNGCSSCL
jgi:hypothetical protein